MTSSSNNGGFSLEGTCTGPEPSQHSQDAIARHPNNFSRDLISWKGNERRSGSEKEREGVRIDCVAAGPDLERAGGTMALRGKITHCIFDMDGLLLDTEVFYTVAQDKVFEDFKECGYQERKQELKGMMMGRKSQDAARLVLRELGLEDEMTPDEFLERRAKILRGLLPQAKLLPGALRLLEHLRDSGVPCALATSSNRPHFLLKTQNHAELFSSCFSHQLCGDDVVNGKPHPEIFLKARDAFGEPKPAGSEACLVFEDSPLGIQGAVAGGFRSVHVPDREMAAVVGEPEKPADQTLRSLEEFRPEEWGLPPFKES